MYTLFGILAILFWSTTIAFSRTLSEQLGPMTAGASIYLLAGLLACLAEGLRPGGVKRLVGLPRRYLWGCGGLFCGYILLLYLAVGLAQTRAQVVAVGLANYMWPSLTLLLALPLQHQRGGWLLGLGIALGLAGTWLAAAGSEPAALAGLLSDPSGWLPLGLALLAALLWGLYSNLARRWGQGEEANGVPLFLLACGLLFLPLRFLAGEPAPDFGTALPALAYMAVFPAYLGYSLWDTAMQRGDLVLVATFSYFTPLLSTIVSLLVLQVPLTGEMGLAALLVTGGAALARRGIRPAQG